jgi:putative ABC transport system permease protein
MVARAIASLLFRTSTLDASTFAGTALVLVVVALTAGAIPALRAARTDPATALRAD